MWMSRRSLALDHVDRCNLWAALFLLLLALVTWLLPLSPVLMSQAETPLATRPAATKPEPNAVKPISQRSEFQAHCWCPAQFTPNQVVYANTVCGKAFTSIMNGGNASDLSVSLHEIRQPGDPDGSFEFKPEVAETEQDEEGKTATASEEKETKQQQQQQQEQKQREDDAYYFFRVTTPTFIICLAVLLKIPHLMWTLLTTLFGGINVDQTLVSANEASKLDHTSRRQLHTELVSAVTEATKSCSWKTSIMYFIFKVLMFVVVFAGVLVIHLDLLPQARQKNAVFQENKDSLIIESQSSDGLSNDAGIKSSNMAGHKTFENKVLFCSMKLMQREIYFSMQCSFSPIEVPELPQAAPPIVVRADPRPQESAPKQMFIYETLYLILFSLLVALAITNFVSLLVCAAKLLDRPCQDQSNSSVNDLPLDVYFLLQKAKENAGPDFVRALARVNVHKDDADVEGFELKE